MIFHRATLVFLIASFLLAVAVFRGGIWGAAINAPLDHAAALWKQYGHVAPGHGPIPANHHIVDQLSYDLPLQWSIYHAWRSGEIPWWSPYTYGGRPLLADAHANATSPLRVLIYFIVPDFLLAYNWALLGHHLLLALGLWCLLRWLEIPTWIAGAIALAGQVAGAWILYIGHPWIVASFAWYPWLWMIWARGMESRRPWHWPAAALLVAAVFFSGNLQSHAYLPLFALAFSIGVAGRSWALWKKSIFWLGITGLLGAMLAAPVLWPQLELFAYNQRPADVASARRWFDSLLSLSAVWPWSMGTFRTISYESIGFQLFAGVCIIPLAALGAIAKVQNRIVAARRIAFSLSVLYLGALATPLAGFLYLRSAGLGMFGILVLAAIGASHLREFNHHMLRRLAISLGIAIALIAGGTLVVTAWIYPRIKPRIETAMAQRAKLDGYEGRMKPLRDFQIANYPREVGFRNPEVLVSLLALGLLGVALLRYQRTTWLYITLSVNLLAPTVFAARFVPTHPVEMWHRLRASTPSHLALAETLHASQARFYEEATEFSRYFPMEHAHFYGIHALHGYAALQPPSKRWLAETPINGIADFAITPDGQLRPLVAGRSARFFWDAEPQRPIRIQPGGLNHFTLHFPEGPATTLMRTDTYYPGWVAILPDGRSIPWQKKGQMESSIRLPANVSSIHIHYTPTHFPLTLGIAATAIALLGILSLRCASGPSSDSIHS